MDNEILAIVLTFAVHVLAVGALVWHLFRTSGDDGEAPDWRGWFRDPDAEPPLEPRPSPGRGGLPLPDAAQSAVRLREPARIADARPRPARRPAHTPEPQPQRARERA